MHYRRLGHSGLLVSAFSLGTATFGGSTDFFRAWGTTDVAEARTLLNVALDAGVNLIDTADAYSQGLAEEILGTALVGRRQQVLLATKATYRTGPGPNDVGASRHHLLAACEASLRRLRTDYIDLYQVHGFDALTPIEETLEALDLLVRSGKVRYVGCSNFSGWQLMKSLAVAERRGLPRYIAHQVYYSLIGRDYEWELLSLGLDQAVGALVWSPLAWGRLSGKIRRGQPAPAGSRLHGRDDLGPHVPDAELFAVVDELAAIAAETGHPIPQVALNWLLRQPTVASVILGARTVPQLQENLAASDWQLSPAHLARLDAVSTRPPPYPYWQHQVLAERNPPPVREG